MEVVLTIPLALALSYRLLVAKRVPLQVFFTACLASLVILSRLDSALWVGMLAVGCLATSRRLEARKLLALCLGGCPLLLYVATNVLYFHTLTPVSGQAKQLRLTHSISLAFLPALTATHNAMLLVVLTLVGLILTPRLLPKFNRQQRIVILPSLLFPLVQCSVLSILSDWPFWPWYLYTFAVASFATLLLLTRASTPTFRWIAAVCGVYCAFTGIHGLFIKRAEPRGRILVDFALARFAESHPGIYAMGDRAGIFSVLTTRQIVQTEGLVMDKPFLEHLARQEDLVQVLRKYGVRYYVANFYNSPPPQGCFQAVEPTKAGPSAKHMRALLCLAPLTSFSDQGAVLAVYDLERIHPMHASNSQRLDIYQP